MLLMVASFTYFTNMVMENKTQFSSTYNSLGFKMTADVRLTPEYGYNIHWYYAVSHNSIFENGSLGGVLLNLVFGLWIGGVDYI